MCGRAVYKWSLIIFNVIFVIIGLCLLIMGILAAYDSDIILKLFKAVPDKVVDPDEYNIPKLLESSVKLFIGAGSILFLVGFLGCCGALSNVKLCLLVYGLVLIIVFAVQLSAGIYVGLFYKTAEKHLKQFLQDSLQSNYKDGITFKNGRAIHSSDAISLAWDKVQLELECCGAVDHTDYLNADHWTKKYRINSTEIDASVPPSCCKVKNPDSPHELNFINLKKCLQNYQSEYTNLQGCYKATSDLIMEYSRMLIAMVVIVCLIEVLGIVFAFLLYGEIRKNFQAI